MSLNSMADLPAEFKKPIVNEQNASGQGSWGATQYNGVMKAVGGSLQSMYAEFRVHREYNATVSEETGIEVEDPTEICLIKSDKFSIVPKRVGKPGKKITDKLVIERLCDKVEAMDKIDEDQKEKVLKALRRSGIVRGKITSELSKKEEVALAPLYERFKNQKDSTDKSIFQWEAVSDMERGFLAQCGVFTVEQLYHTPPEMRHQFGPGGEDLWIRAERFMKAKDSRVSVPDDVREELAALRRERSEAAKREAAREADYFKMQEQLAALSAKRGPGRPKKEEVREAA
jgi:hypothetical protein